MVIYFKSRIFDELINIYIYLVIIKNAVITDIKESKGMMWYWAALPHELQMNKIQLWYRSIYLSNDFFAIISMFLLGPSIFSTGISNRWSCKEEIDKYFYISFLIFIFFDAELLI